MNKRYMVVKTLKDATQIVVDFAKTASAADVKKDELQKTNKHPLSIKFGIEYLEIGDRVDD